SFTIPNYTLLTADDKAPGTVDTGLSGFAGRVHQLPVARYPAAGTVPLIEKQLADGFIDPNTGQPYASISLGGVSDFTFDDVINWWQEQTQGGYGGIFSVDRPAPFDWPDSAIPGVDLTVST